MVDFERATVGEILKRVAAYRGYTMKELAVKFNQKFGTKYTPQTFSKKLINGAVRYDELQQFGELLDFQVKIILNDAR